MSKEHLMDRGFEYLARDMDGALYAYKDKPEKRMQMWVVPEDAEDSEQPYYTLISGEMGVYDAVKWEDEEPTEIETLKSAVRQPLVNPIEFGGFSIHEQKGGGTYIIKSDLYKSVLDQNAEKRKERFNELTGEKISEEPADKPNEEPEEPNSRIYTTVTDSVNHPAHYNVGGIETIDVIRAVLTPEEYRGYLKGNVLEYRERAPYKHETPDEDHAKAKVYWELLREAEGERIFE